MKRSTKYAIAGGIGLAAVAGLAYAANEVNEHRKMGRMFAPHEMFKQMDKDQDKALTLGEVNAAIGERFAMADSDGDGSVAKSDVVSAVEANAPHKKMKRFSGHFADRLFVGSDLNEDGTLTKQELENRIAKMYALVDWNDDGKVEMAELRRMRMAFGPPHHRGGPKGPKGHKRGWFGGEPEGKPAE